MGGRSRLCCKESMSQIEETVFACCHCNKTKSLSLFTPPHPHMLEGASDTGYILGLGFLPHAPRLSQRWAQGLRPSLPPSHQTCWLHSVQPGEKNLSAEKMQTARLGVTVPLRGCNSVPSAWAALLLVCAQVCLRAHPRTQVPVSIFLSPGKPATPPELLLHDGPLALWSAAPAGSRASAATAGCSPGPEGSSRALHLPSILHLHPAGSLHPPRPSLPGPTQQLVSSPPRQA